MKKIKRCISIDEHVWKLAQKKIAEPLSPFIQRQLELACNVTNDKQQLEKELYEKQLEVIAIETQLCKFKEEEKLQKESESYFDKCMTTIYRIHDKDNIIGENQITDVANAQNVNPNDLIKFCKDKGLNVVELYAFNKVSSMKNGGTIR